jgi:hypothetical protein
MALGGRRAAEHLVPPATKVLGVFRECKYLRVDDVESHE